MRFLSLSSSSSVLLGTKICLYSFFIVLVAHVSGLHQFDPSVDQFSDLREIVSYFTTVIYSVVGAPVVFY